ncbi:MAG: acyltransferase family protein [Limisphaerales bacterium]
MAEIVAPKPSAQAASSRAGAVETKRLVSLDALRGFDMFWILGADALMVALNQLGHCAPTRFLATQLSHSQWQGVRFYDLIFPLFVFIMGVSTVFSLTRIIEREGRGAALTRIVRRSILLFVLALIYSGGASNPWPDLRLMGVLNRIALCYFFGALMFCFLPPRALVGVAVALLLGYWGIMKYTPFRDIRMQPDALATLAQEHGKSQLAAQFRAINDYSNNPSAVKNSPVMAAARQMYLSTTNRVKGKYEMGYNVCNDFDFAHLPGRLYNSFWDPEGLLSTIPAIATGLLGIFAGLFLMNGAVPDERKVFWLVTMGVAGVILGFLWGTHFPVIKKIWTSSYVLVAGGYSAILLGLFYWIVDVKKWQLWCRPFVWIGMNPITLYMVSNLTGGEGYRKLAARIGGGSVLNYLNTHVAQGFGNVVVSLVSIGLFFWLAGFMYRRKIFLRL